MAPPIKTRHVKISEISEMQFKRLFHRCSGIYSLRIIKLLEKSTSVVCDTSNTYLTLTIGFISKSVFIEELKINKHILMLFLE